MLQTKDWILITGLVLSFLGYECLPHGQHLDAEMNGSVFAQFSSAGAFLSFGGVLLALGVFVALVSFLVPRR